MLRTATLLTALFCGTASADFLKGLPTAADDLALPVEEEAWNDHGNYYLLNVDRSLGLYLHSDGDKPLRGESYKANAYSWGSLANFRRFEAKIWSSEPNHLHHIQPRDEFAENQKFTNLLIDELPYKNGTHDVRYYVRKCPEGSKPSKLQIVKTNIDDKQGGEAILITAQHRGRTLMLTAFAPDAESLYAEVSFLEVPDAQRSTKANWWYFAREVDISQGEVYAWEQISRQDTYYLYNQYARGVMTPFQNDDLIMVTNAWGNECRFNGIVRDSPWFGLKNHYLLSLTEAPESSKLRSVFNWIWNGDITGDYCDCIDAYDFQVRENGDKLKVGIGKYIDFKMTKLSNNEWTLLKNRNRHEKQIYSRNDGADCKTDGKGTTDQDSWQLLRIFHNSAELAHANPEIEPRP
eukprot:Selendium_serpulae@DN3891_c0_g1_i7.p1